MANNQLETFTDRLDAITLFDLLRGRDPDKPWPLLPILTFIAPGGSGKSILIEYLRARKCSLPDGRAALPYARLDFTQPGAPKTLLSIFVSMRNQLQLQEDGQGRHLTFPRFDLGAAVALAVPADGNLPLLSKAEIQSSLGSGSHLIESLGQWSDALSSAAKFIPPLATITQFFPPLLAGLKLGVQIPQVQELIQRLEKGPGWKWYQTHTIDVGLPVNASIRDVLLRLYDLSIPGKPGQQGREHLVGDLLPAAFVADLYDALVGPKGPQAWGNTANVIFFLDGYEALLNDPTKTGMRLLEVLTLTEHRERGETDPILIVIGSRSHPFKHLSGSQNQSAEPAQQYAQELYEHWKQQLPDDRSDLELSDLDLTLQLQDFGLVDTRNYLAQLDKQRQQRQQPAFTDEALVQAIYRATFGHPLSLALAAAAVLAAQARHQELSPDEFERATVPRKVVPGHEDEQVGDYLLSLFLGQLSDSEQNKLIFCAVARTLDAGTLWAALLLSSDLETRQHWDRYRKLTFVRAIDDKKIVFHPIVRTLLLQRLRVSKEPGRDYYQIHTRLREYFDKRAVEGDEQAAIEKAYHALALGDPQPGVALGVLAQRSQLTLWEPLLEAVAQAPTELMPGDVEQQANDALIRAEQQHDVQDAVTSIVLYTWLLWASQASPEVAALLQTYLGVTYSDLPGGDRQANLQEAIRYYEAASQVYTQEDFPKQWASTQNNLGIAYSDLPGGDRQANLQQAIRCYEGALQESTREAFPKQWASTQNNLGTAYQKLLGGDWQANLQQAIRCYKLALQVYTREAFPYEWAMTQNNLGAAYSDLPEGDRLANLQQAIACYQAALQVWTREAFPYEWAKTQNNLGTAYSDLPGGDRQVNLQQSIRCYQAALQVRTREAFPYEWAKTQNNLGAAYSNLPGGDRQANLQQSIRCYQAALQVRTREAFPVDWAATQNNLGEAYRNLLGGDRQANLQQAIACYQAALLIYARDAFPYEWAKTQNNLGNVYHFLLGGDRQANLQAAIGYYEAALQIQKREAFPMDWAMTQNNLGNTYQQLPGGDREANLKAAIGYFEAALEVFTLLHLDYYAQGEQENLAGARNALVRAVKLFRPGQSAGKLPEMRD